MGKISMQIKLSCHLKIITIMIFGIFSIFTQDLRIKANDISKKHIICKVTIEKMHGLKLLINSNVMQRSSLKILFTLFTIKTQQINN